MSGEDDQGGLLAPHSGDVLERVEGIVRRTQQSTLDGIGEVLTRQRQAVVKEVQALLDKALDQAGAKVAPLPEQIKTALVAALQQAALAAEVKKALLEAVEKLRTEHLESVREVAGKLVERFAGVLDTLAERRWHTVKDTAAVAGRRAIDYAVAGVLFCVVAVFAPLGAVELLRVLGAPLWSVYLVVALLALLAGLVFVRRRIRGREKIGGAVQTGPAPGTVTATANAGPSTASPPPDAS
jgi:hypothetical protein